MPPIRPKDWTMPLAAFGMVFVLGSYIYTSIGAAKRNAATEREKSWSMIMEQRRSLGMDVEDMVADRMRRKDLRAQAAASTSSEADS